MSLKNMLCSFLTVFMTVCLLTAVLIMTYGFHDDIRAADVGVILGNHVHQNRTPSKRLRARLNKGIELYQAGLIKYIIVSGGINKHRIGEGSAMKNYLVSQHIPATIIFVDNQGSNTWHTAINTKALMQKNNFTSVIAISQYYHLARTVFALHRCGVTTVYHAHAPYFEWRDFYSVPREVLAIYYYFFFHHVSKNSLKHYMLHNMPKTPMRFRLIWKGRTVWGTVLLNELKTGFESHQLIPLAVDNDMIFTPEHASEAYKIVLKGSPKRAVIRFT